jgi:hypothetical protein
MRTPPAIVCSIIAVAALALPASAAATAAAPAARAPATTVPATTVPATTGPATTGPATTGPARLQAAVFTSPERGYGLFYQLGSHECRAEVATTATGGRRFGTPHVAASWSCNDNQPISNIAADPAGDVFVYGPALEISHDHGNSWTTLRVGRLLALSAVSRSVWLLTTRCPGHGAAPDTCPVRLLVSANGGRSWRKARLPGAAVAGFGSQPIGQANLVRTSAAAGYVLIGPETNPRGKPNAARIWITANGGASWSRHAVPCGFDGVSAALAVAPGGKIFVACAEQPTAGWQVKSLASSRHGRAWVVRTPCSHGTINCPPLSLGYLSQIAATSNRTVFLVGPRSSLLVTHNAGRTWHTVKPMIGDDGGGTSSVVFFGRRGIVVGDDGADNELPAIWHTSDGGASWHVVHPVIS